jgi:hypothetical protein
MDMLLRTTKGAVAIPALSLPTYIPHFTSVPLSHLLYSSPLPIPTAEDPVTRELVAATLCNISVDPHARVLMVDMGVVDVLATLSATTSGLIQVILAPRQFLPLSYSLLRIYPKGIILELFQILLFFD